MPRRRPEQYQLAFDLSSGFESQASNDFNFSGYFTDLDSRERGCGRFLRTVREEIVVRAPADAANYLLQHVFAPFDAFEQEELWVLMLNTKNRVTHDSLVYRGQIDTVVVRIAEIFRPAVRVNARSIIVSHCHPSGDPTPSPEDVRITQDITQAGQMLGVELLDHLVVGLNRWVSLKERGLGFP